MKTLTNMIRVSFAIAAAALAGCGSQEAPMSMGDLEEFATEYAAAWSSQKPASVAAHYAEDGSLTVNEGEPAVGREAITATAQDFMSAFPDMIVKMDRIDIQGDYVNFHWIWTGTNTGPGGTGNAVRMTGYEQWLLNDDGLIAQSKGQFDEAEYQRQLAEGYSE